MLRDNGNTENEVSETVNQKPALPVFKFKKVKDDIDKAIKCFLTGHVGKFGNYVAVPNALVYRNLVTPKGGGDRELAQNIIALKIERPNETLFIGNSSVLPLIGRGMTYGHERLNRGVTDVQTRLSQYIPMIPFSVFAEAGLNLTKIELLERGPEETVTRTESKEVKGKTVKFNVDVHYTGASLFKVEDRVFLFDIDRREIQHKIFNAFMVQLKTPAKTIAEAYQNLKPKEVVDAEKRGLKVLRQGEWFFIPVSKKYTPEQAKDWRDETKMIDKRFELQAGENRPNYVNKGCQVDGKTFVTGKVEHAGREHAALLLKQWYQAIPNTSIQSFTITGDVD